MKTKLAFIIILFLSGSAFCSFAAEAGLEVDNSIYEALLKKHVSDGTVSYKGLKSDEELLDRYLGVLEKVEPEKFGRNEKYAFYINSYNAWTLKLILTGYPGIKSIKDLGSIFSSPWKKKICRIAGKIISLDDIEHGILRPEFKDPRVHFAINCASRGCPKLISEPYSGKNLETRLDSSARTFINDPSRNRLEGDTLYLSSIFKWFSEDFGDDAKAFVLKYASDELGAGIRSRGENLKIEYLDYDWSLNGK